MSKQITAPFPWFGGKSRAADLDAARAEMERAVLAFVSAASDAGRAK